MNFFSRWLAGGVAERFPEKGEFRFDPMSFESMSYIDKDQYDSTFPVFKDIGPTRIPFEFDGDTLVLSVPGVDHKKIAFVPGDFSTADWDVLKERLRSRKSDIGRKYIIRPNFPVTYIGSTSVGQMPLAHGFNDPAALAYFHIAADQIYRRHIRGR